MNQLSNPRNICLKIQLNFLLNQVFLHFVWLSTIDIVDRLINRFSNPGDLVLDPFGGLGTVPYRALHLGRRGRGVELNPGYYLDALKYLHAAEADRSMPSLFDLLDESSEVPA